MAFPFESIEWQNSNAKLQLARGGSKAGGYQFLREKKGFEKHLPSGTTDIQPGDDSEPHLRTMNFDRKKIVRAYHPLDVFGMVDVLKTIPNLQGILQTRRAIQDVLAHVQQPEVRSYIEYEFGQPFDGKVGVLVQDCNTGARGSILEHPHQPGIYRVGVTTPLDPAIQAYMKKIKAVMEEEVCTDDGKRIDAIETLHQGKQIYEESDIRHIDAIIAFYRHVRDSGLMPHTHSYQMEFGFDDVTNEVLFYQARLFKLFSPRAEFEPKSSDNPRIQSRVVFPYGAYGTTPEEGVSFPVAFLDDDGVKRRKKDNDAAYIYANTSTHESTDLSIQPTNVAAYLACSGESQLLPHGHYRWMQKAPVTVMLGNDEDLIPRCRIGSLRKIRVISNGINGMVEFPRQK
ncbi:hypothetical protein COU80_02945 [Candidatus Peregrinibacteria bacterium CG10_big_fil_rev_8_21_14_0_10_55_24]|nr:MAG: hypothetical protein COU80_02945 [Candidatus Peregrinibacteria bacterium CG10_big_fil_rev_8_21_14_0_10_55_24]